uniref:Uncharacterized protein n=1 Tax=Arundo donax TaxID=35708 RepID=A0A0A9BX89_ARUDO
MFTSIFNLLASRFFTQFAFFKLFSISSAAS